MVKMFDTSLLDAAQRHVGFRWRQNILDWMNGSCEVMWWILPVGVVLGAAI